MIKALKEWGTLVNPQYVTSQCGAQKLLIDGYSFVCHRVSGPRTYWRCDWCQKSKCKATVATESGQTYLKDVPHNHPRSKNVSAVNRIYSHLKTAVANSDDPIPEIVRRVLRENQWEQSSGVSPTFETMCRSMQRFRSRFRSGQRRLVPPSRGTQENTTTAHQSSFEPISTTCAYGLPNVFENGSAMNVNSTQQDQPISSWLQNAINVTSSSSAAFTGVGITENVKEEDGDISSMIQRTGVDNVQQHDDFQPSYQQDKKNEDAAASESLCGDAPQHSLIRRVIEGYKHLCCVRRTAESSVSRKSIIAMFSNSTETGCSPSEKTKEAKYDEMQKYRQIEMPFLVDFVTKVFTEIAQFESVSKAMRSWQRAIHLLYQLQPQLIQKFVSLFRNFVPYLWLAEMGYLSLNAFNSEPSSSKLLVSMWQFIDETSISSFFDSSIENAASALRELLNSMLDYVVKPMSDIHLTEIEFAILVVFLFAQSGANFNDASRTNPEMQNALASIRETTLCAADAYYESANLGSCAVRIASIVSIAFHIKMLRERFYEAMKALPITNVFEADPFL